MKNMFYEKITYLHSNKGQEMVPTMGTNENTLLVHKLPVINTRIQTWERLYKLIEVVEAKDERTVMPRKYMMTRFQAEAYTERAPNPQPIVATQPTAATTESIDLFAYATKLDFKLLKSSLF